MYLNISFTPNAVVICVIIFNAAFGYSWGPLPWLYPPEIMPLSVRAKGVSLSTATNWAFNFIVGEMTPYLQEVITWRLYVMHGFFCACSFVLVYFFYPETKGVPLEEMDTVFGEDVARHSVLSVENMSDDVSMIREDHSLDLDDRRRSSEHGLVSDLMKQWKKGSTSYRQVGDSEESARLNEQSTEDAEDTEEGYEMDSGDVDRHD
jgi:hypothetical protein